jgi:GH25 family lysozyme M1 (1,4-beta-N-acetylmuramidase)
MYNAGNRFVIMKAGGNGFDFHTARYIRVTCNGSDVNGDNVFNELSVYDTTPTLVSLGATVTSSIAPTAGALANFTDGSLATSVTIGSGSAQWVKVDLGVSTNIRYFILKQVTGRTFNDVLVEYSTDDIAWSTIFDVTAPGTGTYVESSDGALIVTADASPTHYSQDAQMTAANIATARAAGLKVGFYWFKGANYYDVANLTWLNTAADGEAEAILFKTYIENELGGGDWGDIYPQLDFENQFGSIYPSFTNDGAYDFIEAFVNKFRQLTGKQVMLYTAYYTIDTLATVPNELVHSTKGGVGSISPLWLAANFGAGVYPSFDYLAFGDYVNDFWTIWQYSSDGNGLGAANGVNTADIDLNYIENLESITMSIHRVGAVHGKNSGFSITDSAGTPRSLNCWVKSVSFPSPVDVVEVSTLCSLAKEYVVGLKDHTISIEGIFSTTPDGYLYGIMGTSAAFVFYPGTTAPTAGKYAKYTGNCFLTSYEVPDSIDAAATFTAEFQIYGDVSRSTSV